MKKILQICHNLNNKLASRLSQLNTNNMKGKTFFGLFFIVLLSQPGECQKEKIPLKLMFDFVDYFIGKSVVLHANTKDMKTNLLMTAKEVNKAGKYATISNYLQKNCSMRFENVDVHLLMFNSESLDYLLREHS